ncbi:G1/S-specific cyclin-D3-like isoform X2 [Ornithodoros turicata]|uniref:G1/S-specific cyclin-D3-like isoform X2 n=1 Tax=Ornithodoros turicata TaxID=34597 RepID=UPI0031391E34
MRGLEFVPRPLKYQKRRRETRQVCEEQGCEDIVFPCAMNYLDRYLARTSVKKSQLQLLGAVCLLMASKMRQCRPITVESLVYYTDFSVTAEEVKAWEILVLSKLDWDMASILANDFVDHLICWLGVTRDMDTVRRHANTFISLCATEYKFVSYAPCLVATASVAAAIHGLGCSLESEYTQEALVSCLQAMTGIESELIVQCVQDIESLMVSSVASLQQQQQQTYNKMNSSAYSSTKLSSSVTTSGDRSQLKTPTDVQDINF